MLFSLDRPIGERFFGLRLDTLVRLRWLAVAGQTLAIIVVQLLLGFSLPIGACLAVVALSAWLNLALRLRNPGARRLSDGEAAWLLAYDILQLAALLFLTGGLANPFALLVPRPGADLGDRAVAAHHHTARPAGGAVRRHRRAVADAAALGGA